MIVIEINPVDGYTNFSVSSYPYLQEHSGVRFGRVGRDEAERGQARLGRAGLVVLWAGWMKVEREGALGMNSQGHASGQLDEKKINK